MTAITLRRTDASRNMHRFYRLDVQRDLFGQWCCVREWGRIGSTGHTSSVPFPTPGAAQVALERQRRAKERRGYQ
jgi:predicted DNA-binding WGR domain protein